MNKTISICIVGAGSSYTPELIEGILQQSIDVLPITMINMMDTDVRRLEIMAALSRRMIKKSGRPVIVHHDIRLERMLAGVDFVITQVRVGGMAARYLDESIPVKYGLLGQETTGAGGMFKALRTIPKMIDIANAVARIAPQAFILNYTNPSGMITEAVSRFTDAKIIGLCSGIPGIQNALRAQFEKDYPDFRSRCVGLNHLGFIHQFFSGNTNITDSIIDALAAIDKLHLNDEAAKARAQIIIQVKEPSIIGIIRAVPIGYLDYFFARNHKLEAARAAVNSVTCRSQQVMEIERKILAEAADPAVDYKPAALAQRGGGGYSMVTFTAMKAIWNNTGEELATSVRNNGAVEGIDNTAIVEVVCSINGKGATPLPVGPIPPAFRGLIQAVKAYESLTVEAAVTKNRRIALQAMLNHPLMGDLDICTPMLDEMAAAHHLELKNT